MNKNIKSIALCILIIAFVLLLLLPCLYKESFSNATCISPDDLHLAYAAAQRSTRASHAAADRRARKNSRRMRANEGGEGESIKIRDNILTSLFLIQQCFSKSLEQIHGIGAASVVDFNKKTNELRDGLETKLNQTLNSKKERSEIVTSGVSSTVQLYIEHGGSEDYVPRCLDRSLQNNNCQELNNLSILDNIQDEPAKRIKII